MEPEIIEPPFESEDWITFSPKDMIENVSMVRITTGYSRNKKDESREVFNLNINDYKCKDIRFCSFYMMLKKSKYSKANINENSYEITFSSKVFNLAYFRSFKISITRKALLQYKKVECNSNEYYDSIFRYWKPMAINHLHSYTGSNKLDIDIRSLGAVFYVKNKENDSLDKYQLRVLVNGKEKYTTCVEFYSDTLSAHFLQLNTLTLEEIANIYDNKKPIKMKNKIVYTIDFLDNKIYDILVIHKGL